jgi:hypothetical protein
VATDTPSKSAASVVVQNDFGTIEGDIRSLPMRCRLHFQLIFIKFQYLYAFIFKYLLK